MIYKASKGRIGASLAAAVLLLSLLLTMCGCAITPEDTRPKIVCTTFVLYDWVSAVLGDTAEEYNIIVLGANGADIHSYQPTVKDIAAIRECELFVHIGGESDKWVDDTIKTAANGDLATLKLSSALEQMLCSEHEHEGEHEGEESEHTHSFDEHIWFSFELACASVTEIEKALTDLSPERADELSKNAASYRDSITALKHEYITAIENSKRKEVVIADRYPFGYLFSELGILHYAAFEGCSAESEASFEVIRTLSAAIDLHALDCVLICEGSDSSIATAVISNSSRKDARILTLNSLQSVTQKQIDEGVSYISIMRDNLEVLKEALGS